MSTPSDILLKRAEVLIDQERYELAQKELYKILAEEPQHVDAIANLIRSLTGATKYVEAKEWLHKLLSLVADRAYFYYLAAFVEVRLKEFDEAEKHIRTAIELEPDWAMHFEVLSRVYQHRGNYEDGLFYANEGLHIDPDHIDCLDARLFSLAMLGYKEEAWETINHALSLEPENPYLRRDIGVALMHLGEYDAAEVHLQETLRIEPSYEDAKKFLGKIVRQKSLIHRVTKRVNDSFDKVLSFPSNLLRVRYGYILLAFVFLTTSVLFIFFKQKSIVQALLIIPALFLSIWISLFLIRMLFNIIWKPVGILADLWLYTYTKHRYLYNQEDRKTTIVTSSIIVGGIICIVSFYIWMQNTPAIGWIVLGGILLYYSYKYTKKTVH